MKKAIGLLLSFFLIGCSSGGEADPAIVQKSEAYRYTAINTDNFPIKEVIYVPAYPEIHTVNERSKQQLTVTLSIRNTSRRDSIYLDKVEYYDSRGQLVKNFIDKTILLESLELASFVVEQKKEHRGSGASFLVYYASPVVDNVPEVQAVMIGAAGQQGLSFLTRGKVIDRY